MSTPELLVEAHPCPIAKVHTRLEQAHRMWHEAEQYYFDPELFPTYLNSAIQALRSVTWILQKYKRAIPDFDKWYAPWQKRMRADAIMSWLVHARNRIEKEGDLDGQSSAVVRLIDSYLEPRWAELTVTPWLASDEIAKRLYEAMGPPPSDFKDASLTVERRWVENNLPEREALDALAYCYGFLSELVSDAHKVLGLNEMRLVTASGAEEQPIVFHGGRLPCMVAAEQGRTTTIRADTGAITQARFELYPVDPSAESKAREHYGEDFGRVIAAVSNARGLRERATALFEMAKQMLQKDRYHGFVVMLYRDDKPTKVVRFQPADRTEKFLMWRDVAREVEVTGATTVITIAEAWTGRFDSEHPERQPVDDPERTEVLQLFAETMDGEIISIACPFARGASDEIILGDTEEAEAVQAGFMLPVKKVWEKWKESDDISKRTS